jgi:hypothetical protein
MFARKRKKFLRTPRRKFFMTEKVFLSGVEKILERENLRRRKVFRECEKKSLCR